MMRDEIEVRREVDAATEQRDVVRCADAAVQLVKLLLADGRPHVAAADLEYAIAWLAGKPRAAHVLPAMLRLLAALYDDLGDASRSARARASARAYAEVARASA